ncbi:MAG: sulfurtransferase [Gaiellaceae bacterium]
MSQVRYRFVDVRWSLDDPEAGRRAYLEGHVPGAAFVDVERELADPPGVAGRHPLPSAARFVEAMSRAGIDEDTFVVAYGSLGGAERLWWLLRHHGHEACAVLDLDAWHGQLTPGEETAVRTAFVSRPRAGDTIERAELAERLDELVVVDARVSARWRGERNPVDRVPGRVPGSLNAPWNEEPPVFPPGELVSYCGSGVTACVVLHRLHLSGRDGRLFPGSWSEWEQYPELPVERST